VSDDEMEDEDEEVDEEDDGDEVDEEGYEDGEEEQEEEEEEEGQDEAAGGSAAIENGEELLCRHYLAPTGDAVAEDALLREQVATAAAASGRGASLGLQVEVGLPLQRPTTPGGRQHRAPVDMSTPGSR
jgi:hypothetical protein